jgi:hypothetical protein
MKKISIKVTVCLLATSFLFSSCFVGKYSLWNKYISWQNNMTNNKFVNAIAAFILVPIAGTISTLCDVLVLNSIEFWSGSNPIASNVGKTRQVMGEDGRSYAVTTLKDGYEVKAPTGEVTVFTHDAQSDAWFMEQNGEKKEMFRYNADGKTIKATINNQTRDLSLDESGLYQARMMANGGTFFAMN